METDWFGNPIERPPDPVDCPMCGASFSERVPYEAHLSSAHGVRTGPRARRAPTRSVRDDLPALGQRRRSALSRRLHRTPLVLVLTVNVAMVLVALAALDALGPAWWDDLRSQPWGGAVIVPMLWPTIVFLFLRGVD